MTIQSQYVVNRFRGVSKFRPVGAWCVGFCVLFATAFGGCGTQPAGPSPLVPEVAVESQLALPEGALRMAAVGDSLTEGEGDEMGLGGYTGRLLARVQETRPGSTMLNLGHSGWTSDQLINGAFGTPSELDAAIAEDPDIVFVWIGNNDLWQNYSMGPIGPDNEQVVFDLYAKNIETIISELTASGARVIVGLNDDQSKRPVSVKQLMFPDMDKRALAQMSAMVGRFNEATRAAAKKHNATVVDFFDTVLFEAGATMSADDVHPNATGYEIISGMWFKAIQSELK